jgi:hypothetical protein
VDAGDLEHNRRGLLGPGQRARLEALIASYGLQLRVAMSLVNDPSQEFLRQLHQSLKDGRVVAATGEVGMDLPAFRAGTAERRVYDLPGNFESAYLAALDGGGNAKLASWINVLPGRYAVYRAVPVGFVVGVEHLAPPDHAQRFFRLLCAAQRLAAETLVENRRGRMAEAQKMALRSADQGSTWIRFLLLGALCAFFAAGGFLDLLPKGKVGTLETLGAAALALLFIVSGIGSLVSRQRLGAATRLDMEEGRIEAVDGPLQKSISATRHQAVSRKLEIGPRTFNITDRAELYAVLVPGFVYRAYLAPRSGQLLAIELAP